MYCHTLYFCLKRTFFAYSTVNFKDFMLINNVTYFIIPIMSIVYVFKMKPMKSKILNYIEIMNDLFLLWTGYFIFIFSDFVLDPKYRNYLGLIYQYSIITVLVLNFIFIILECKDGIVKKNLEKRFN